MPIGAALRSATAVNHFYPKLDAAFANVFRLKRTEPRAWIKRLVREVVIENAYWVAQGWFSVPMPGPVRRGQGPRYASIDEFTVTLYPHEYETPILDWQIHDAKDSNAPVGMEEQAEQMANGMMIYRELTLEEMLLGAASTYLHPDQELDNMFGGTGLFSNSHSFNGQTLDNSLAGTGTTVGAIGDDLYTGHQTFDEMVNSEGEKFWMQEGTEASQWTLLVPSELRQAFDALFDQTMFIEAGGISATTNYIKNKYGSKVKVEVFDRLSDASDWYLFRTSDEHKPLLHGVKDELEKDVWLMGESDWSKRHKKEGIRWRGRWADGYGVPQTALKFTNS